MPQMRLANHQKSQPSYDERVCSKCMGHRALCGIRPCPLVMRALSLSKIDSAVRGMSLEGSSPPSVFVGSFGYPKVLAGPLVPPIRGERAALMEQPNLWLDFSMDEILALRFSLVRTKQLLPVDAAVDPPRVLAETQTMALSEAPTDSEALLLKRPEFTSVFSERTLPVGPSAPLKSFTLEDNPKVPKPVDKVTADTDLKAGNAVTTLFDEGISQEHLIRLFSIGLLGTGKKRRLVPTEWSITAVDDIVSKRLHKRVLRHRSINDFLVFSDHALGNTVTIMMMPGAWQFEVLECWLSGPRPMVISDHEYAKGRSTYASNVVGAYYAVRLPVLKYLDETRRQAGALVFLEVNPREWVPLGVWRFREIAKRALTREPKKASTLEESLEMAGENLINTMDRYLEASDTIVQYRTQTRLDDFF
ncbi:MAG: Nre family DNA repair protein [Candidatus Thorarchaeota archaeon]